MLENDKNLNKEDSNFRSITKEEKQKYFNPLYLSSPLLKIGILLFIIILCCLLVSIWFIKINIYFLVLYLILFELFYVFFILYIIKFSLKLNFPDLSNKVFLKKDDLIPILKYQNGLIILDNNCSKDN